MKSKFISALKLIRVKHYIKNLLIFIPLFFSGAYKDINNVIICLFAFLTFSFCSSIIYIINDIFDIEKDKLHEKKKNRPLASGALSKKNAYFIGGILIFFEIILILLLKHFSGHMSALLLIFVYVIINILYSKGLKNVALLDVIILVVGFLIRLFFGALIIDCEVSNWLYLTVMSGAFYMGFGKRRNEITKIPSRNTRSVLKDYNKEFLDKSMYVCLTLTVVFYSMWAIDPVVNERVASSSLIWTIPLLLIILFQYSMVVESDSDGDPVEVILGSRPLLGTIFVYIITIFILWM